MQQKLLDESIQNRGDTKKAFPSIRFSMLTRFTAGRVGSRRYIQEQEQEDKCSDQLIIESPEEGHDARVPLVFIECHCLTFIPKSQLAAEHSIPRML